MGTHRAWWQRGVSSNNFETAMWQHLLLIVMMRVTLDAHDDEGDYKHRHHLHFKVQCANVTTAMQQDKNVRKAKIVQKDEKI